jgi:hypothetical protein
MKLASRLRLIEHLLNPHPSIARAASPANYLANALSQHCRSQGP